MPFTVKENLTISSPAFEDKGTIPLRNTVRGDNIQPSLFINDIPKQAKSLVVMVDEKPKDSKEVFNHWVVWNIYPTEIIREDLAGTEGMNDYGKKFYIGPDCVSEAEYIFRVFALDTLLPLDSDEDRTSVLKAMKKHVLARGEI